MNAKTYTICVYLNLSSAYATNLAMNGSTKRKIIKNAWDELHRAEEHVLNVRLASPKKVVYLIKFGHEACEKAIDHLPEVVAAEAAALVAKKVLLDLLCQQQQHNAEIAALKQQHKTQLAELKQQLESLRLAAARQFEETTKIVKAVNDAEEVAKSKLTEDDAAADAQLASAIASLQKL